MKVTKYNKGEMYWYINPDVKKENYLKEGENQDFLDNRPVLIISNYIDEYHSSVIIVPTTTSAHRNGIVIDMENSEGNIEKTSIMPMRPRLVPIQYLKTYIGKLDPDILEEVYESLDFHLGRSSIIPDYVIKDKKIHETISKKSNFSDINTSDVSSKKYVIMDDITKMRKNLEGRIDVSLLKSEKDVKSIAYDIKNINKKAMKKIYDSIKSIKDKYECANMDNKEIAKKYSININQAIVIKNLCVTEIAIYQLVMINKLLTHNISISSFSLKDKIIFLSIENSELKKYVKKGETVINNYKSKFSKELKI